MEVNCRFGTRIRHVSSNMKRQSIYPGRSVTLSAYQRHLVNYLNNIARSSKVLKWKYFQIHGPSFEYRIYHQRTNITGLYYSLFCLKYIPMYMQINTSCEKIHKLTSLKFEVLNVAEKTINAIPSQYFILNVSGSFYLYM